jgi:hypothetical protein
MIYSIIHYPKNQNEHIIFTTTNLKEVCSALEEFGIRNMEKRCGLLSIQKDHPRERILEQQGTEYYCISKLNKIEVYRLKKGWLYNSRSLVDEYKIIRCSYHLQKKDKKLTLRAVNEDLLNEIRSLSKTGIIEKNTSLSSSD